MSASRTPGIPGILVFYEIFIAFCRKLCHSEFKNDKVAERAHLIEADMEQEGSRPKRRSGARDAILGEAGCSKEKTPQGVSASP
jgi:hypothetical protein